MKTVASSAAGAADACFPFLTPRFLSFQRLFRSPVTIRVFGSHRRRREAS
jgi:hypothetical protein